MWAGCLTVRRGKGGSGSEEVGGSDSLEEGEEGL
jgi:hypothetical protein